MPTHSTAGQQSPGIKFIDFLGVGDLRRIVGHPSPEVLMPDTTVQISGEYLLTYCLEPELTAEILHISKADGLESKNKKPLSALEHEELGAWATTYLPEHVVDSYAFTPKFKALISYVRSAKEAMKRLGFPCPPLVRCIYGQGVHLFEAHFPLSEGYRINLVASMEKTPKPLFMFLWLVEKDTSTAEDEDLWETMCSSCTPMCNSFAECCLLLALQRLSAKVVQDWNVLSACLQHWPEPSLAMHAQAALDRSPELALDPLSKNSVARFLGR